MARTIQKKYTHKKRGNNRKTRNMRKKQGGGEIMDISFFTNPSNLVCTPITINDDLKNIIFPLYIPVISSTDTTQQETINHVNKILKWLYEFREDIHDDNNNEFNNFFIMTIDTENNSVIINDLNIRTEKTEIELKFIFASENIVLNYKDKTIPVQIAYDENNKYGYFALFKRLCIGFSIYDTLVGILKDTKSQYTRVVNNYNKNKTPKQANTLINFCYEKLSTLASSAERVKG